LKILECYELNRGKSRGLYEKVKMNVHEGKVLQRLLPGRFARWLDFKSMNKGHKPIYENVARVLKLKPEDDLLEVACGNGFFLKMYASHVHSVAGLDISELSVALAMKKNKDRVTAGAAEFVCGEASQLPWEDNKFSVATCMGTFPWLSKPFDTLKEIHRVLRPAGRVVISIEWHTADGIDRSKEIERFGHETWSEADVRDMFKAVGFWDISITYAEGDRTHNMMIVHAAKH
jgi:ubiquinone/menaquinone biosynthesis C-methylase UbiE